MNLRKGPIASCCLMLALFTACGGGRSSAPAPENVNGVFADALVEGMPFACGSQKGMTGAGGTFTCPGGSTVTFTIGSIQVCSALVQALMTPVSCAQATDPSANTSTAAVVAVAQLLLSISTTAPSTGTLTITSAELQAAADLSLDFATVSQADLLTAVKTITNNPAATLVSQADAIAELTGVVGSALAGNFSGTYSGGDTGTWSIMVTSAGVVSGSGTNSKGEPFNIAGDLVSGTQFTGTAGSADWTGNMDTSKSPPVFSGTWMNGTLTGTFTGTKQ
jgi:hypothetical protein